MVGADGGTVGRRPGDDPGAPVTPLKRRGHKVETAVLAGADRAAESCDGRSRPGGRLRRLPRRRAVPWPTGRALLAAGWLTIALGLAPSRAATDGTRVVTDSAGRRVVVPARIERVFAAGPPATVFVYTLAPDALLGWYRPLTLDERAYIPPRYAPLPTPGK